MTAKEWQDGMKESADDWFSDLKYEFETIFCALKDLFIGIFSLLYFLFVKPVKRVYFAINNFYWLKIASKKHIYSYVEKFILSGKAKHFESLQVIIRIFKKHGKLTEEQGSNLEDLFIKKHPLAKPKFRIPELDED